MLVVNIICKPRIKLVNYQKIEKCFISSKYEKMSIHSYPCHLKPDIVEGLTVQEIAALIEQKYPKDIFDKYVTDHERSHTQSGKSQCRGGWQLELTHETNLSNPNVLKFRIIAVGSGRSNNWCYAGCGKYSIPNPKAYEIGGTKYKEAEAKISSLSN
jgi:hypothetical protein